MKKTTINKSNISKILISENLAFSNSKNELILESIALNEYIEFKWWYLNILTDDESELLLQTFLKKVFLLENPNIIELKNLEILKTFDKINEVFDTEAIKKTIANNISALDLLYHKYPTKYDYSQQIITKFNLANLESEYTFLVLKQYLNKLNLLNDFFKTEKSNKSKFSYKTTLSTKQLKCLFELLIEKYIAKDNAFDDFKKVFSNVPLNEIKPIKWNSKSKSEVVFFLVQLNELKVTNLIRFDYDLLRKCFVDNDSNEFKGDFKSLKNNIFTSINQTKQIEIIEILNKTLV